LLDGKKYVGSSAFIYRRLNEYLNPLYIARNLEKGNSKILNTLLKYGYHNFEFQILENLELDSDLSSLEKRATILQREQHYLDIIKPEYNLNLKAGSSLGRKFSEEVKQKMRIAKLGKPGNKKGATLSLATRALFREKSGVKKNVTMLN
jgi:group I intron endonuclease